MILGSYWSTLAEIFQILLKKDIMFFTENEQFLSTISVLLFYLNDGGIFTIELRNE